MFYFNSTFIPTIQIQCISGYAFWMHISTNFHVKFIKVTQKLVILTLIWHTLISSERHPNTHYQTPTKSLKSKLTFGAVRCLSSRQIFLTKSLHLLIGPFQSGAVMKRWVKSAITDIRWHEGSILYQEFHSIPPPFLGCNVERRPWFKRRAYTSMWKFKMLNVHRHCIVLK